MPRLDDHDDEFDDAWDGDDDIDADEDPDDDEPTIDCPYCGAEMLEDSPRCPACGTYLSKEDAPPRRRPGWIVLGVVICLLLVYLWTVGAR